MRLSLEKAATGALTYLSWHPVQGGLPNSPQNEHVPFGVPFKHPKQYAQAKTHTHGYYGYYVLFGVPSA